jgi:hypothetical protein
LFGTSCVACQSLSRCRNNCSGVCDTLRTRRRILSCNPITCDACRQMAENDSYGLDRVERAGQTIHRFGSDSGVCACYGVLKISMGRWSRCLRKSSFSMIPLYSGRGFYKPWGLVPIFECLDLVSNARDFLRHRLQRSKGDVNAALFVLRLTLPQRIAAIPLGSYVCIGDGFRWCRCARPQANRCDPVGIGYAQKRLSIFVGTQVL